MSDTGPGRRDLYPNDHGRMEMFRGMEALCDHAEASVLHPQSPEGPGLPQGAP